MILPPAPWLPAARRSDMTFFRPRTLALQLLALALLALGAPAAGAADPYQLQPDTATLKSSWKEFFSDPVYLNLSSETRKGIADRLFTELIENDTAYAELAEPLRGEARAFFYARAGVPPPVPADAAGPGPGAETSPLEVKAATSPVIAAPPAAQAAVPEAPAKKLPPQPLGQSWFEPVPPQGPLSQLEIIEYAALKAQEALYPQRSGSCCPSTGASAYRTPSTRISSTSSTAGITTTGGIARCWAGPATAAPSPSCIFRAKPDHHSGANHTSGPIQIRPPFRTKPDQCSGANQTTWV